MHGNARSAAFAAILCLASPAAAQHERPDRSPADRAWGRTREASALTMIRTLDMLSFPNSIGPRRTSGKRTLADYGFTVVKGFDDGWAYATEPDKSWQIGVFVLTDGHRSKRLCITDGAIGGGTYRSTTAIDVAARPGGTWHAIRTLGPVKGCR